MSKDILSLREGNNTIKCIISRMSLKEKIAQMLMVDASYWLDEKTGKRVPTTVVNNSKIKAIEKYGIGGVILFRKTFETTKQTLKYIADLQKAALSSNQRIPLLVSTDQEGGAVTRVQMATNFGGNAVLGAVDDENVTRDVAGMISDELYALGINVDFAPDLDINNNPDNPIIGVRSFSSEPEKVARMGKAFVEGLHKNKIAISLKHFPGHGNTDTDSHTGLPRIETSYEELKKFELIPYASVIRDADVDMIMSAHILYPNIEKDTYISKSTGELITLPATLSKKILTDILRKELGYDGIIVTDALNMFAISKHFEKRDSARLAINAGADILLMPNYFYSDSDMEDVGKYIDAIAEMVQVGEISHDRIDEAVTRILLLKEKLGLFEKDFSIQTSNVCKAIYTVGSKAHHDKEFEVSKKAITLIKNNSALPILPKNGEKVLVLSSHPNQINSVIYAFDILKEYGVNVEYEVADYMQKSLKDVVSKLKNADYIVATVSTYGRKQMDPNEKDGWQASFLDDLIEEVHKEGKKLVIVSCYLPYDVARYQKADAIMCCYSDIGIRDYPIKFNGNTYEYGVGITSAIVKAFLSEGYTGKLPFRIYKLDEQYNYTDEVLYEVKQ